jgi:hypothetical protein
MEKIRIGDAGWKTFGSGIRDKHPGSATLMADPYSNPDRDPGFLVVADPVAGFGNKKLSKKILWMQKSHFYIKNCNIFILMPPRRTLKLENNSLVSKENIQHFKTCNFFTSFFLKLFLPVRIRIRNTASGASGQILFHLKRIRI